MRHWIVASVAAVLLSGCGSGSTDFGQNFVGTWNGVFLEMVGTQSFTVSQSISITVTGANSLTLAGVSNVAFFCSNGSGPPATATSATEFSGGTLTCPPVANGIGCPATNDVQTTSYRGGSGTLNGTVLTIVLTGTDACSSGTSTNFTQTFTGSR